MPLAILKFFCATIIRLLNLFLVEKSVKEDHPSELDTSHRSSLIDDGQSQHLFNDHLPKINKPIDDNLERKCSIPSQATTNDEKRERVADVEISDTDVATPTKSCCCVKSSKSASKTVDPLINESSEFATIDSHSSSTTETVKSFVNKINVSKATIGSNRSSPTKNEEIDPPETPTTVIADSALDVISVDETSKNERSKTLKIRTSIPRLSSRSLLKVEKKSDPQSSKSPLSNECSLQGQTTATRRQSTTSINSNVDPVVSPKSGTSMIPLLSSHQRLISKDSGSCAPFINGSRLKPPFALVSPTSSSEDHRSL